MQDFQLFSDKFEGCPRGQGEANGRKGKAVEVGNSSPEKIRRIRVVKGAGGHEEAQITLATSACFRVTGAVAPLRGGHTPLIALGAAPELAGTLTGGLLPDGGQISATVSPSIKIRLSGRLRGVRMARKLVYQAGGFQKTQSLNRVIDEEAQQIFTKWGTIGIRITRGG